MTFMAVDSEEIKAADAKPTDTPDRADATEAAKGLLQQAIGEIELLAGVINADPLAQAEGEFNIETGGIRARTENVATEGAESSAAGSDEASAEEKSDD